MFKQGSTEKVGVNGTETELSNPKTICRTQYKTWFRHENPPNSAILTICSANILCLVDTLNDRNWQKKITESERRLLNMEEKLHLKVETERNDSVRPKASIPCTFEPFEVISTKEKHENRDFCPKRAIYCTPIRNSYAHGGHWIT